MTGLIASGPFLILVLYDRRYADAAWIIQFLGAMTWFQILENANASALLAKGRADWMAARETAQELAGMVVFLWLGFAMAGFPGALLGLVLAEAMKYAISANGVARCGLPVLAQDMVFTAVIAAVSWAGFAIGSEVSARFQSNLLAFLARRHPGCRVLGSRRPALLEPRQVQGTSSGVAPHLLGRPESVQDLLSPPFAHLPPGEFQ